jgi:hypothetical protein
MALLVNRACVSILTKTNDFDRANQEYGSWWATVQSISTSIRQESGRKYAVYLFEGNEQHPCPKRLLKMRIPASDSKVICDNYHLYPPNNFAEKKMLSQWSQRKTRSLLSDSEDVAEMAILGVFVPVCTFCSYLQLLCTCNVCMGCIVSIFCIFCVYWLYFIYILPVLSICFVVICIAIVCIPVC